MGNPWVYFGVTLPIPMSTVPERVQVQYDHGVVGFTSGLGGSPLVFLQNYYKCIYTTT